MKKSVFLPQLFPSTAVCFSDKAVGLERKMKWNLPVNRQTSCLASVCKFGRFTPKTHQVCVFGVMTDAVLFQLCNHVPGVSEELSLLGVFYFENWAHSLCWFCVWLPVLFLDSVELDTDSSKEAINWAQQREATWSLGSLFLAAYKGEWKRC